MITEAELEVLTSAGLMRRARKSLASSKPEIAEESSERLFFAFDGRQGEINLNNYQQSKCSCPASGLCKHILATTLFCIEGGDALTSKEERYKLPHYTSETLAKVNNKAAWRKAYKYLMTGVASVESSISVEPDHCKIRWESNLAVIGLSTRLSSEVNDIVIEGGGDVFEQLVAAILLEESQGRQIDWPRWIEEEKEEKTRRLENNQKHAKEEVKETLVKLVDIGITRIATTNLYELDNLVPKLRSLGYRRIANLINALSEWISEREAQQGTDHNLNILYLLGQIYAQCDSTDTKPETYKQRVSALRLYCVGGHQWEAESGSTGLTMIFLSDTGRLEHASISRPAGTPGFSSTQAWKSHQLWDGAPQNNRFAGTSFELKNIAYNQWRSISLKKDTQYFPANTPDRGESPLDAISKWEQLMEISEYGYALVKPRRWVACDFDEKLQELQLTLEDKDGRTLLVRQPYKENVATRITATTQYWTKKPEYLVLRHRIYKSEHLFEPISLYTDKWVSLDFESKMEKKEGLLRRIIARFSVNINEKTPTQVNGLDSVLLKFRELLCQYPETEMGELEYLKSQLELYGLGHLKDLFELTQSDSKTFLKVSYIVCRMIYGRSRWPIY